MRNINLRYVVETYDETGFLTDFKLKYPDNFNFGYDIVDDIGTNDPDRPAMLWMNEEGYKRLFTFGDIMKASNKVANFLRKVGIQKGDIVMAVLKRDYRFWFLAPACHKLGAVLLPATHMLKAHDAEYRINASGAKAVVSIDAVTEVFDEVTSICPSLQIKIAAGAKRQGWLDFDEGMEAAEDTLERVETNVKEPMLMYFSSGTSGYPKMVLHNHTYALSHIFTAKHWHNADPEGLHLTIADTGWGKAVWGKLYGQWIMECCVFTYDFDKFVPADILRLIGENRITSLCCPPTMYRYFLKEDLSKFDLSSLKYATIAGEPLNPDVFYGWLKATGITLMEGFGQTETTLTICNRIGMTPKAGSVGKPSLLYDVRLINSDGEDCKPGETGEIVIGLDPWPEGLMVEYYKAPEKTAQAMRDGFYHTGDTAWRDEDGYIFFVGRNDDIIKSSGYRIGPYEVESVLVEHPAVLECAVSAAPDEIRGQVVKATVILNKGYEPSEELVKELQEFVKKQTAPYKYPRIIEFTDALPRTINGKIRRAELREKQ
jgi:acetyl-CoA synthetase